MTVAAAAGLAQLGLTAGEVVVSLVTFVVLASLTIAGPIVYNLVGGDRAKPQLDALKAWLVLHNVAVMAAPFRAFSVVHIGKALGAPTT